MRYRRIILPATLFLLFFLCLLYGMRDDRPSRDPMLGVVLVVSAIGIAYHGVKYHGWRFWNWPNDRWF
jgi:hypothetical protein